MLVVQGLLLALTFAACSDGLDTSGQTDNEATPATPFIADPVEDQKEVMYAGKTAVIDYDFDDMGLAIFSRMANRTGELTDDVDAVLLSPKVLNSDFAIEEAVQLVKLYEQGAAIIMIEPRDENWQKLGTLLKKAEAQMMADSTVNSYIHRLVDNWEMLQAQTGEGSSFGKQDAVALRLDDTYMICDLQEQADSCSIAAGEPVQEVSAYRYGKSADLLVEWLKKKDENQTQQAQARARAAAMTRASSSSAADLDDVAQFKRITVQRSVGPSRIFGKSMPYEFVYEIYSLYNISADEEYYLIRQHIDFHCKQLGCTKNATDAWSAIPTDKVFYLDDKTKITKSWNSSAVHSYDCTYKAFGPYMRKCIVKSELTNLAGSETVYLMDPQPGPTQGTQTTTSGFSFNISPGILLAVNFGKNSGTFNNWFLDGVIPKPALRAGVTKSDTYTVTSNERTYTQEYDNLMASWTIEGIKPHNKHYYNFVILTGSHDKVGEFQTVDWSTDLTWYYRIVHPDKKRTYKLHVTDYTEIAELLYSSSDYELAVHPTQTHTIELPAPNRYMQEWVMTCSNEQLLDNIRNITSAWVDQPCTTALTEEGVEESMAISFNYIKSVIKGIGPKLAQQGYDSEYTFRVRKAGSKTDFMKFTMKNGVVE